LPYEQHARSQAAGDGSVEQRCPQWEYQVADDQATECSGTTEQHDVGDRPFARGIGFVLEYRAENSIQLGVSWPTWNLHARSNLALSLWKRFCKLPLHSPFPCIVMEHEQAEAQHQHENSENDEGHDTTSRIASIQDFSRPK